ncbi:MAG: tetratricopeptide repeat-containing sulfotransferase family protein [Rhodanobacteraceae bacterium]
MTIQTLPSGATPSAPLSPVAQRLLARARAEAAAGRAEVAGRTLESVLALAPGHPDAMHELGTLAYARGDYAMAARCFQQALPGRPDDADERIWLGIALHRSREFAAADVELRRACELAPDCVLAWYNLGEVARALARPDEAIAAFERALAIDPTHTPAMLALARTRASAGHIDVAVAGLREILKREPDNAEVWFALANLKVVSFEPEELAYLERAFADTRADISARVWFGFTLSRALEDHGDYARAFGILESANALQRSLVEWEGAREHARIEAIMRVFESPMPPPRQPGLGGEVIFIACIPRSGSTLIEQILASHPAVEGANEIEDLKQQIDTETWRRGVPFPLWVPETRARHWWRMGQDYLRSTARWRAHKPRFTDKSLSNWALAGPALAMLPAARVVVGRRDPLETCLACYRQLFTQGAAFSFDLDEMADYCIDFMRLTRFWLEKFPDRVMDLEYETLVAEPEPTIRRLLDFCGLPFDPACLEFHRTERAVLSAPSAAQVRQPLQKNTARAARYGDKLDHLRKRLRDAGLLSDGA